ncbi:MAG: hypothetical protein PF518_18515 [Spirochaetaceae bacterium]|jgi:class 3 adenylate cyclase|nr:hypothetical protein [Spirochaetaceae bacterium]
MNSITENHLISVYDIENYIKITKKLTTPELFDLMRNIQSIVVETVMEYRPLIIKNLGDSNLIVFNSDDIELKIEALRNLKTKIEDFLSNHGFPERLNFASHFGEITVGVIGIKPYSHTDAFGNEINYTFYILGNASNEQFTISQNLYDRMNYNSQSKYKEFLFK